MGFCVHLLDRSLDGSVRPDDVGDTIGPGLIGIDGGMIGKTNAPIGIRKQRKVKIKLLGKCPVRLDRIKADTQDNRVSIFKLLDSVPESFPFDGSARGVGHGIEPEDHRLPLEIGQLNRFSGIGLGRKGGRLLSYF